MCAPRDIYPPKKQPALKYPAAPVIAFAAYCWLVGGILILLSYH